MSVITDLLESILLTIFGFVDTFLPMEFMNDPKRVAELVQEFYATIEMLIIPVIFSTIIGLGLGVLSLTTKKGGILENKLVYFIIDKFINFFRSVPFIILIALLGELSTLIVGVRTGRSGMYIPLIFGMVAFYARQIESVLADVDSGVIEASASMGKSPRQIIFGVYLRESIPGIVRATSIMIVAMIGLVAMAGQVGGGGLGSFAIRYGHARQKADATWAAVFLILVLVSIVQGLGNYIAKKTTH